MMDFERRRFLGAAVGVGAAAVTSGLIGRTLLNQRASAAADVPPVPPPRCHGRAAAGGRRAGGRRHHAAGGAQLATSTGSTPACSIPRPDVASWSLTVNGMVDHPFTLNYEELLAMPLVEQYVTIACVSNEVGGDLVGNALWRGARLRDLLDRAGVQEGATQVVGRSVDKLDRRLPDRLAGRRRARGAGGGGHERRSAAAGARLSGTADRARPVRLRVRHQVADQHRADHAGGLQRLLGAAGLGQGGADPDAVAHRRAELRRLAGRRPAAGGGRRLGAGPRRQRGGGAGRRRGMGGGRAIDPDLRRHLGAVALPLGRAGRRPHPARARHRRHRRGADRHRHASPLPTERAATTPSRVRVG